MPLVLLERRDQAAWITINRPEQKNMLNAAVMVELVEAWNQVRSDREVRVAVLTGAGAVDFCTGGDLAELIPLWTGARQPSGPAEERAADPRILDEVMLKRDPIDKPIIAAVNGRALGGGSELVLLSDIRIASDNAEFALPEARYGVVPGGGGMARLARQIPYAHAMKLMMTGASISADEALAYGLISEVVPQAQLIERAEELAAMVCRNAPISLSIIKRVARESSTMNWPDAFRFEARESLVATRSKDAREGPRAFKERRPPIWSWE